jgi:hypothetical protein
MPTVMIALNIFFAVFVVGGMVVHFLHGIATQHHDHGVESSGSFLRRRVWSRPPARRSHAPVGRPPGRDLAGHVAVAGPPA